MKRLEDLNRTEVTLVTVYMSVCIDAESIIQETGKVEGAHYAALRRLLEARGLLELAEEQLHPARRKVSK